MWLSHTILFFMNILIQLYFRYMRSEQAKRNTKFNTNDLNNGPNRKRAENA